MVQLKFYAQLYSSGLFSEEGRPLAIKETPLSQELWDEIDSWGYPYEIEIPFDCNRFSAEEFYSIAKKLDLEGLGLLSKIADVWKINQGTGEKIEFQYISEALGELIDPPTEENYFIRLEEFIAKHKNEFRV